MTSNAIPDNQLILQRATNSCRTLDDLRYQLHSIQKRLAKVRQESSISQHDNTQTTNSSIPARDETLTTLLHAAYTLQFQISTLLSASEEPIPERERADKSKS